VAAPSDIPNPSGDIPKRLPVTNPRAATRKDIIFNPFVESDWWGTCYLTRRETPVISNRAFSLRQAGRLLREDALLLSPRASPNRSNRRTGVDGTAAGFRNISVQPGGVRVRVEYIAGSRQVRIEKAADHSDSALLERVEGPPA
jgi:hypothetical protein